ncbi:hypothetical protein DSUL_20205 [Desulfovibrionales bacterium]
MGLNVPGAEDSVVRHQILNFQDYIDSVIKDIQTFRSC